MPDTAEQGEVEALIIAPPRLAPLQETITEFKFLPIQMAAKQRELEADGWQLIWTFEGTERWWRTRRNGNGSC